MKNPVSAPAVSVVMPVYNGGRYLDESVRSILIQTYTDFEFIIVNDGSTDRSGEALDEFSSRDRRVVVHHQENRGQPAALNVGLSIARGKYVARMDADDISEADRLAAQLAALEADERAVLVSCEMQMINGSGSPRGFVLRSREADIMGWHLLFRNMIGGHGQVMFRLDEALSVGGYDETLVTAQDYDLWCKLWSRGRFVFLPEFLYQYRVHGQSISQSRMQEQEEEGAQTCQAHLRRRLGLSLELDVIRKLRSFWEVYNRPSLVRLEPQDVNEVEGGLRLLHETYLTSDEGRSLARQAQGRIRRSICERYLRWALRLSGKGLDPYSIDLLRRAFLWAPIASLGTGLGFAASRLRGKRFRPPT